MPTIVEDTESNGLGLKDLLDRFLSVTEIGPEAETDTQLKFKDVNIKEYNGNEHTNVRIFSQSLLRRLESTLGKWIRITKGQGKYGKYIVELWTTAEIEAELKIRNR